jgi:hypothetical protein
MDPFITTFSHLTFQKITPESLNEEIDFVREALSNQGFYPKDEPIAAFRGDSRDPSTIRETCGFFRKAFSDKTKIPTFKPNGGVRDMIGCSTDFNVALGFTKFPVQVQQTHGEGLDAGWVYAFYIPANTYYDPRDYKNAFLGYWGKEIDATYIPFHSIVGALYVEHPKKKLCIHNYLTHVPDYIHKKGGCQTPYVDQVEVKIKQVWINQDFSFLTLKPIIADHFYKMYEARHYIVQLDSEDSEDAKIIAQKYNSLIAACANFEVPYWKLTVRLKPSFKIEYIPKNNQPV